AGPDVDFGCQGLVNRAFPRDFHQLRALFVGQLALEVNLEFDPINSAFLGFAFLAIRRMDFEMTKRNRNAFERPFSLAREETDRHRRARAERGEQKIVRRRTRFGSAECARLIGAESMRPYFNFLRKVGSSSADDHVRLGVFWHINAPSVSSSRAARPRCAPD